MYKLQQTQIQLWHIHTPKSTPPPEVTLFSEQIDTLKTVIKHTATHSHSLQKFIPLFPHQNVFSEFHSNIVDWINDAYLMLISYSNVFLMFFCYYYCSLEKNSFHKNIGSSNRSHFLIIQKSIKFVCSKIFIIFLFHRKNQKKIFGHPKFDVTVHQKNQKNLTLRTCATQKTVFDFYVSC